MAETESQTTETISDIHDYIHPFDKDIEGNVEAEQNATSINDDANQVADTIFLASKDIASGIVLADPPNDADQSGNYQTFMVVNDVNSQNYMLLLTDDSHQPTADNSVEQQETVVAVATEQTNENESTPTTATARKSKLNNSTTPTSTGKRTRFRQKRIKEEVVDDDSHNDISVYDFNDLPNRNQTTTSKSKVQSEDEETDSFKTPVKTRCKPTKAQSDFVRKAKSTISINASASGSNVHVCTYCNYTTTKRYLLSRHLKSHSEDRPHKCGICERGFKTLASLQNHVNTHTGVRPHQCKFCEAAFTTSGELVRHIRYRHTHEKPHRCSECDYASVELSKLKRHMRCHTGERPYQCPHCTYASPDTYKLKRHLRIHTGEKPYLCDVCNQRFTQSNSLKAHKLIHSGNKPVFKCEYCPTTCGRKTDLRIHVQKLHTSDKMLTCKRCDQSFPDRYQFKMHLKTHEGEKCFKCDLCNYASVSGRHLESHMLIHTDQKPFVCEVCHLSFRQKQLLKRHKNLYHNPEYVPPLPKEKTHECSQCSKAFRHKGNLIRHMSIHDPEAKNNISKSSDTFNNSRLIDDEVYENEDYETNEDTTVSIVGSGSILNTTGNVSSETIAIAFDAQTQQLINQDPDNQLMLVMVPNSDDGTNDQTGPHQAQLVVATTKPNTRSVSKRGRTTRNSIKQTEKNVAQVLFDSVTEAKPIATTDENVEEENTELPTQQAPQIEFDNTDTINIEEQLQKQKDLEACFGFKDEDDEDEIILSMPAVHGQ